MTATTAGVGMVTPTGGCRRLGGRGGRCFGHTPSSMSARGRGGARMTTGLAEVVTAEEAHTQTSEDHTKPLTWAHRHSHLTALTYLGTSPCLCGACPHLPSAHVPHCSPCPFFPCPLLPCDDYYYYYYCGCDSHCPCGCDFPPCGRGLCWCGGRSPCGVSGRRLGWRRDLTRTQV